MAAHDDATAASATPAAPVPDAVAPLADGAAKLALTDFLREHHERLLRGVERGFPAELRAVLSAEDICQEAYVAAFRKADELDTTREQELFGWLETVAENKLRDALDAFRAVKRGGDRSPIELPNDVSRSIVDMLGILAVTERTPSLSAVGHEAAMAVRAALTELKAEHREAIELRIVQGLSAKEAASRMERTPGAVEMLCQRGLKRLQELLGALPQFASRKP